MSIDSPQLDWPICNVEDCQGRQVDAQEHCLAHTTTKEREAVLDRLAGGAAVEVGAGVHLNKDLLAELLAVLPHNDRGAPVLHEADFRSAVLPALDLNAATLINAKFADARFEGDADFRRASFEGGASFEGASFGGGASFEGASFGGGDVWYEGMFRSPSANFAGATFNGDADFRKASFRGAYFRRASFQGDADFGSFDYEADFEEASFHGSASFGGFQGDAGFVSASFHGTANFVGDSFQRGARFYGATFHDNAQFHIARFQGRAGFAEASFHGAAAFPEASFHGTAEFDGASFQGVAGFAGAKFYSDADFGRARFLQPIHLGPLAVAGTLSLDGIETDQPVQLETAAWRLSCKRTRFHGGGHIRVAWAEISLEEAEIPVPLIISHQPPNQMLVPIPPDQLEELAEWERELLESGAGGGPPERPSWLAEPDGHGTEVPAPQPSLVSVQRAAVTGLVLADIDVRNCHFAGAHHLDQLQLTTADAFYRAPGLLTRPGRPGSRGRQALAEECRWQQAHSGWRGRRWRHTTSEVFSSPLLEGAHRPGPAELAAIYRRLRKGREDAKNEPGANDFYYGEMEMRRHAPDTAVGERLLLGLYWLTAGYALRASRALATLFVILAATTVLLTLWGLPASPTSAIGSLSISGVPPTQRGTLSLPTPPKPAIPTGPVADRLTDAGRVERAARTALGVVVFRDTGQQLTTPGHYIEMAGRLLGPVLLALALLSVRNRVKR